MIKVKEKVMLYVFIREDNGKEVVLSMTYPEWLERIYAEPGRDRWWILLDDGGKAWYSAEKSRKLSHRCFFRDTPGNWPMESYAAGIAPEEIPEFSKFDKEHGVPTHYSEDGDPIFTDKAHRKKYLRAHEMYDRNAGYSDPTPVNR